MKYAEFMMDDDTIEGVIISIKKIEWVELKVGDKSNPASLRYKVNVYSFDGDLYYACLTDREFRDFFTDFRENEYIWMPSSWKREKELKETTNIFKKQNN